MNRAEMLFSAYEEVTSMQTSILQLAALAHRIESEVMSSRLNEALIATDRFAELLRSLYRLEIRKED